MLHILGSMKTLRSELASARIIFKGIIDALKKVNPKTSNLIEDIGIFAVRMPEYKIISKDADSAKKAIRKVCTGEISAAEALKKFEIALKEIDRLIEMLDNYSLS